MAKKLILQDDGKFCIFVTKRQEAGCYFKNVLHRVTGFDNQSGLEFLILDCNI